MDRMLERYVDRMENLVGCRKELRARQGQIISRSQDHKLTNDQRSSVVICLIDDVVYFLVDLL